MFDCLVQVGIVQHDESVATTEFQCRFFQMFSSLRRHNGSCGFAASQCHSPNAGVFNDLRDLFFGKEKIGVSALGSTRVMQQLLKGQSALRHAGRVFHHHHVARHQIGRCKSGYLIVGKVPGLNAKQHADWAAFNHGLALGCYQLFWGQKLLCVVRVVIKY